MKFTVTAKIQISVSSEADKAALDSTFDAYRSACNYVSGYVFRTRNLKQFSLNEALYAGLREKFGLKSQMAQSVIKTVIARYKAILAAQKEWTKPSFKKPQYDLVWNRDYSLTEDRFSLNTLAGRLKLSYFPQGMEKYFNHDIYEFGTARLVNKHDRYFLHIPVTREIEECPDKDICNVTGVDRGINFIVAAYDSRHKTMFVSGRGVKQKRAAYKQFRRELQKRGTSSARRRLKALGSRENRWMQDVNHCVSKALVQSNPRHTLFVLEDLSGVRAATERVRRKDRYESVSWSFYDLERKLIYKAREHGQKVIKVDPRYTSQTCPVCGHVSRANRDRRNHIFRCGNCGYTSNDDRIAAMNLYRMGINYRLANGSRDEEVPGTVTAEQVLCRKGRCQPSRDVTPLQAATPSVGV